MRGCWVVAVIVQVLVITTIVGSYLSYLFQMPLGVGLLGVLLGSFVAIALLGYGLLLVLSRTNVTKLLESHGLTIYRKKPR
jgi:multisubunit Na+/H+ antiporter MnhC subunit